MIGYLDLQIRTIRTPYQFLGWDPIMKLHHPGALGDFLQGKNTLSRLLLLTKLFYLFRGITFVFLYL